MLQLPQRLLWLQPLSDLYPECRCQYLVITTSNPTLYYRLECDLRGHHQPATQISAAVMHYLCSLSIFLVLAGVNCVLSGSPRTGVMQMQQTCLVCLLQTSKRRTTPNSVQPAEVRAHKGPRDQTYTHAVARYAGLSCLSACVCCANEPLGRSTLLRRHCQNCSPIVQSAGPGTCKVKVKVKIGGKSPLPSCDSMHVYVYLGISLATVSLSKE